jgi:hypothetical protein
MLKILVLINSLRARLMLFLLVVCFQIGATHFLLGVLPCGTRCRWKSDQLVVLEHFGNLISHPHQPDRR